MHLVPDPAPDPQYRLWVSTDQRMFVRLWDDGTIEAATRPDPAAIWGPPVVLEEEAA